MCGVAELHLANGTQNAGAPSLEGKELEPRMANSRKQTGSACPELTMLSCLAV